ncbi:epoxide hydrolase family protein [Brachybacterium sp. AOP43-C2-M15]|uniref:epoxide hydrolase family protein n=1 Tax=Brachybacterium sp. AOP43-C2-M15 TaxID=3457661 RepID=UPI004034F46F
MTIEPFEVAEDATAVAVLRDELAGITIPEDSPGAAEVSGMSMSRLAGLVSHWRDGFDWRAQVARLNTLPQVMATIDGQRVHAVVAPGEAAVRSGRLPVILSHGWPYSFVEMTRIVPALTAAGLDVVIPSLPGFGFSAPFADRPFTSGNVADLWNRLMTEGLGYERYLTYGEDVGASVSDRLAASHPDHVAGLFATHAAFAPASRRQDLSEEESAWLAWLEDEWRGADGYARLQTSRPDLLAVALLDSPTGLLAWVAEKLLAWSGDAPEQHWSDDDLLTTVTLYWLTGSIGTSFRAYSDGRHETDMPQIEVPVRVKVQHGERGFPRSYAARTYLDLRAWEELPDGGHFPAWQNTAEVASGIIDLERDVR